MQPPPFIRYHGSVALEIFCIDMCTFTSSKIRTPPYTEQLTMVSVMSLLQRFLYTGLFTVVPVVSLLQRFLYTGLFTVVPVVSLLQRFLYTGLFTVVPVCVLSTEVSLYVYICSEAGSCSTFLHFSVYFLLSV